MAFSKFFGKLSLQDGTFTLSDGKLQSANAIYSVKGTASYDRSLALKMERSTGPSYAISGTLESPRVQTVNGPPAEAALR